MPEEDYDPAKETVEAPADDEEEAPATGGTDVPPADPPA